MDTCFSLKLTSDKLLAFDEVAAHDVEWGSLSVDWLSRGHANKHKQAYVSFKIENRRSTQFGGWAANVHHGQLTYGLHFLYQLEQAASYEQRLSLLKSKGLPCTLPGLAAHLKHASPHHAMNEMPGGERLGSNRWSRREIDYVLREESTEGPDDLDSNSFAIWKYTHKDCFANYCVFRSRNSVLRKYGYVMWDLPEDSVPKESRRRLRSAQQQAIRDLEEIEKKRPEMEQSWKERASIYAKGGRGYWDIKDMSRITWEKSKED